MKKMAIHTFLVSTICDFWPKFHTFWSPTYIGGLRGPDMMPRTAIWRVAKRGKYKKRKIQHQEQPIKELPRAAFIEGLVTACL
jgi:hypothetical protein